MGDSFDYDQTDVHARYDQARRLPPETQSLWARIIAQSIPQNKIETIVDLGCGTGRFSSLLAETLSARVCGIDRSEKMLAQARKNVSSPDISFLRGSAEAIPLADNTIDLIFLSMVYHHIQNRETAISGFRRILRGQGYVCVRTSTRQNMKSYCWCQFFPEAMKIEASRVPDRTELINLFQSHGFNLIRHIEVNQLFASDSAEYLEKIERRALSSLQAISDEDFCTGLTKLRSHIRNHCNDDALREDIDLFIFGAP